MSRFQNARAAEDYLVSRIVEESQLEGHPLSEPERRMLCFSESREKFGDEPDDFGGPSDQDAYEEKIISLIKSADRRACQEGREEHDTWWAAIRLLKKQDHYLVVMIDRAGLRPRGDLLRLWATGIAVSFVLLGGIFLLVRFDVDVSSKQAVAFYVWIAAALVVIAYGVFRLILGMERFAAIASKVYQKLFLFPKEHK